MSGFRVAIIIGVLLLVAACDRSPAGLAAARTSASSRPADDGIEVHFSPQTDCRAAIIGQIQRARSRVLIQAYSFKSPAILEALADAVRRGVAVRVIIDADKFERKVGNQMIKRGIDVWIDAQHDKAHSKVMLIDGDTVVTGSFNFTEGDEEGKADNVLVITGKPRLAEAYEQNFQEHAAHSRKVE